MNFIRNLGHKLGIEDHAQFLLFMCLVTNLTAFYVTRSITTNMYHYDVSIALDHMIPCVPFIWSYLYLFSFPFWAICYIIYANQSVDHVRDIFFTDLIGKIICFVVYVSFPTSTMWPEVPITDYWSFILNAIWYTDQPNNLFPSIHAMVSWISWLKIKQMHTISDRTKALCFMMVLLIFLAILFTKQHLILDIPSAMLAAEIGNFITNRIFAEKKRSQMDIIDKSLTKKEKIFA